MLVDADSDLGNPNDRWGGLCDATGAAGLAADAVRLHTDEHLWSTCSGRGRTLRTSLFGERPLLEALRASVERALSQLTARREADYVGESLWHHRQRSTAYFSRWIEMKNQLQRT
mmetsp:Transcript_8610/g.22497  ORF Transcript_8610/g.22497 Transcript_8610/m.22497 type:complete len:115 (-) Transcript_8610:142-486(-)